MYARFEFENPIVRTLAVHAMWKAIGFPQVGDRSVQMRRYEDGAVAVSWNCWTGASAGAYLRDREAHAWTCGRSTYWIDSDGLHFDGSRRSFEQGSTWFDISYGCARIGYEDFPVRLVEWSSTIPGNPDPFANWEGILAELEEEAKLYDPPTEAELIEAQFQGWAYV